MTKKNKGNKKDFLFFGPDKDYFLLLRISIHNGESGSHSSLWKTFWKKKQFVWRCWYHSFL